MTCKRLDSTIMQNNAMQFFLSMNSTYGKEKSSILLNHKKALKTMQLSIYGINTMRNYQENVSENQNAHAKLALFPNININKLPNECKVSSFDYSCKEICNFFAS